MNQPPRPQSEVEAALGYTNMVEKLRQSEMMVQQGMLTPPDIPMPDSLRSSEVVEPPPGLTVSAELKTLRERVFSLEQQHSNLMQRILRLEQILGF